MNGNLAFATRVDRHFRFLVDRYGFRHVEVAPDVVRYESSDLLLTIDYDGLAVALSISPYQSPNGRDVTHWTVLRHFGIDAKPFGAFQASTADTLEFVLRGLAGIIVATMPALAAAPDELMQELCLAQAEVDAAYTAGAITQGLLAEADSAWRDRDLSRLVDICGKEVERLPPAHRRRYDYARRKVSRR